MNDEEESEEENENEDEFMGQFYKEIENDFVTKKFLIKKIDFI
jgi:hypothetical protein